MTFLAHGAIAAAATAAVVAPIRKARTFWLIVAVAFVLGTMPDTLDAALSFVGLIPRWTLYGWFHHSWPFYLWWLYPVTLHYFMDIPLHTVPGANWWPLYWWAEVLLWAVSAMLFYVAIRDRIKTAKLRPVKQFGIIEGFHMQKYDPLENLYDRERHYARSTGGNPGAKKPKPPRMYQQGRKKK